MYIKTYFLSFLFTLLLTGVIHSSKPYKNGGIYLKWEDNGTLTVNYPKETDCFGGCDSNRCDLGLCFAICYDKNKDFYVSEGELSDALQKNLSWIERKFAKSAKQYIDMYDGSDGSKKDERISPTELQHAKGHCKDLKDMDKYLCQRCEEYKGLNLSESSYYLSSSS